MRSLLDLYAVKQDAIKERLREFANVPSREYFYELLYCLMTPQTSAESADRGVQQLRSRAFETEPIDPEPILRDKRNYIRFHKTKARHLLRMKQQFPTFLRNVGRNGGLAILDRHILRNLKRYGAVRSLPSSLSRKQYLRIERKFMKFAEEIGIPIDELDLLFWSMETGEIRK